jgi:hypothetical protein
MAKAADHYIVVRPAITSPVSPSHQYGDALFHYQDKPRER